ncbi:MAG: ABC transporter ATP-binding protein [Candidatus Rifleibacteriota bacterium]
MLRIEDYSLTLSGTDKKKLPVLENVSLHLKEGTCLGIAGESGSGKSVLAMSILGLMPKASIVAASGRIFFKEKNLLESSEKELRKIRGKQIGFIFQEPMTAMNPLMTLYQQVAEIIETHCSKADKEKVKDGVMKALKTAGFKEPEKFLHSYPHQLSGGMRQRAMIAIGIAMEPDLIIADEPTTAIDAGLQVQLLKELRGFIDNQKKGLIFISHDLGVLKAVADDLAILYAGHLMEFAKVKDLMSKPYHPYTRDLIAALPRLVREKKMPVPIPGNLPQPDNKPTGCVYSDRCRNKQKKCVEQRPRPLEIEKGRWVSCFYPLNGASQ